MLALLYPLLIQNLRGILRDRMLHAVLASGLGILLLVPSMSTFSMRQVQELSITLSLSAISIVLLLVTLLLGSSSVWRDIEKRYTNSVLTLPMPRSMYLVGKFLSFCLFLCFCGLILGLCAVVVIMAASAQYPSGHSVPWGNILLSVVALTLKYILLGSFTLLLSTLSTSFFLPFFGGLAIYFAGSASQEVYEYISGSLGENLSPTVINTIKGAYYLLPNFSAFDYQVQAVYGLTISMSRVVLMGGYFLIYSGLLLGLAIWSFNRRQLP